MQSAIILETSRLILREISLDDLDFVAAMWSDPEVMRYYPKCNSREETAIWIQRQLKRYAKHGHSFWLAVDSATKQPVGQVGVIMQQVRGIPNSVACLGIQRHYTRDFPAAIFVSVSSPFNRLFPPPSNCHIVSVVSSHRLAGRSRLHLKHLFTVAEIVYRVISSHDATPVRLEIRQIAAVWLSLFTLMAGGLYCKLGFFPRFPIGARAFDAMPHPKTSGWTVSAQGVVRP